MQSGVKGTDKTLNSSFNPDLLDDMMNMSIVSFKMDDFGQLDGMSDTNLI